jgi:hypothetical protein
VGDAEVVQDAVQAALLIQRVDRWDNDRGVGVLTGWQDLVRHSGGEHVPR